LPSFTIGVVLPAYSPFFTQLLGGLEAASTLAAMPFVCNAKQDPDSVLAYLDLLVTKGTDGIIVISSLLPPDFALPASAPPVVFADIPGAPSPSVEFDLEGIAFQATTHLLSHGHEAVALIAPPREWANVAPKYRGYEKALQEAGLPVRPDLIASVPDFGIQHGRIGATRLLAKADRPTAVYAAGDILAIGALQTLKEHQVSIPQEIALVGSDDLELAAVVDPPLTTITTPAHEMGSKAMTMLDSLIQGQPTPSARVVLHSSLVRRASCGCEHS
jgi:DNA-binding LacI/PurR family transcriptional regulator